ncbi:bifunctional precorrin-2 dehydrogenase/sirohydrochlorin ferrochelatase [Paenibacillus hodogayensis]|uniref:precorrin-2 dehydrogenase n=1 Tax=Paenibacillus hodogayensis TaxID=279208 RepID=A0ABV5VVX1_9BACL
MRALYPIMTDVAGRSCLVVGGGRVAERKIAGLLAARAAVEVVSPTVTAGIAEWEQAGRVTVHRREYAAGDGAQAALVFAATDRSDVNERVHVDASARGQPVNVADRPELCTFVVPAVWRRGHLLVAVSTSGTNPLAASRIRDRIEAAVGGDIDAFLEFASAYRLEVLRRTDDPDRRRKLLAELFGDEALEAVRAGRWNELRAHFTERLEREAPPDNSGVQKP